MDGEQAASKWDALNEDKDQYRERIFQGVRGWLRNKASPRVAVLFLFLICAGPCVGAAWWVAALHGRNVYGPPQAAGLILAWPFFMLLLRMHAGVVSRRMDLSDDWREFLLYDKAVQADELRGILEDDGSSENIQHGLKTAIRGSGNHGGIIVLFFLGVLTLGVWLVWSLLRNSSTLLAGIILDGELVPRHPALAQRIGSEEWYTEATAITGFHFFGLIVVALIVGYFCFFFSHLTYHAV